ncbi:MAG: acyl-CoA dehydrogenase family protein [Phenylobacterium sp.]|uniref:acyl-CoA dehydrogenase family protein n=2 Tax=Phenylobacterium sp. TaxID=1871053 RepID=UPI0025D75106|nr:acyl-CoA dehydrogenase family protein [Phenylobacterium sp.]MCA6223842.1 acyl-CoA dehydrogenase family protein [Phenylobacterium sp.]MCA6232891.1 acyl-CoA dehydrogenase family protein [Phenylobacterium sp.]MCA6233757.1 acyl-CoA dehydrogenase family protein [Phenylobacterium sp.]MCA6248856.1 acyl-CoA dehydrogenase family protein [Phenylobacterium sp.]MCA6252875.1 acyl-CoA dehydrogenase family protein [Phenylobacterium sp.]
MDFSFTEEQSMLRDTVASYLADNYGFDQRRAALGREPYWRPDVWSAFADELGILGAAFPEALGGLGGGYTENMVVMEELGKALVVEPYLGTVVIGGGFLKHGAPAGADELIGQIIAGKAIFAFAYAEPQGRYNLRDLKTTARKDGAGYVLNGHKAVVVGAPYATHLVVTARTGGGQRDAGGISVFIVPKSAKGVTTRDYPTVDGFRASEVYFENVALGAEARIGGEGEALPLVEKVVDEAIAATCAEACGVLRRLQEGTVEYTKQRKQFGVPISSFQVLQHRMVDMFIQLEQSISMTYMATIRLSDSDAERAKAASAAKVQIGKACKFVGQNAIQLHGGMGMTDEMAIGHYFKRATMIEGLFGSTDHHLARYEALSLGAAA